MGKEVGEGEMERLREMDLVVEEWTALGDGEKEAFLRNLFSTFSEPVYQEWWMGSGELVRRLQVMVVMWELENFLTLFSRGG